MEFGSYIRAGRKRLGQRLGRPVTQKEVESYLGIFEGGQSVSRWERGANLPKAWQVELLIHKLDLDEALTWTLYGRAQATRRAPTNGAEEPAERAAGAAEADEDMPASEDSERADPDTPAAGDGP